MGFVGTPVSSVCLRFRLRHVCSVIFNIHVVLLVHKYNYVMHSLPFRVLLGSSPLFIWEEKVDRGYFSAYHISVYERSGALNMFTFMYLAVLLWL